MGSSTNEPWSCNDLCALVLILLVLILLCSDEKLGCLIVGGNIGNSSVLNSGTVLLSVPCSLVGSTLIAAAWSSRCSSGSSYYYVDSWFVQ